MRYRRMGGLDAEVSVLGFGGAAVSGEGKGYGFGEIQEQAALDLLRAALDLGINLFDTAPIYGFGLSEQRIGKAFVGKREKVFLVSKCGVTWDRDQRVGIDNSPKKTQEMLHQSLRDLQTDYIDLYFVHWPDPNVDIRRTMEVLAKARQEQKIRSIGLSNTSPEEIARAMEIDRVDVLQGSFNLFDGYARDVLFPLVDEHGMGFMSYGTLDKGVLTGRVTAEREKTSGFDSSDIRSHASWWKQADRSLKYKAMAALRPLLQKHGHSGLEIALGYVLRFAQVSTALCGVRDRQQLESAVAAVSHLPDAEFLQEAEDIALDCLGKKR
ncbi:aldo/keto reductase [Myxococcota bacterium]|nr:aldo/keto reductase [Myxococcota bacterium]